MVMIQVNGHDYRKAKDLKEAKAIIEHYEIQDACEGVNDEYSINGIHWSAWEEDTLKEF